MKPCRYSMLMVDRWTCLLKGPLLGLGLGLVQQWQAKKELMAAELQAVTTV